MLHADHFGSKMVCFADTTPSLLESLQPRMLWMHEITAQAG